MSNRNNKLLLVLAAVSVLLPLLLQVEAFHHSSKHHGWHRFPTKQNQPEIFPGQKLRFAVRPRDKIATSGEEYVDFYCVPASRDSYHVEWSIMSPDGELVIGDHHQISPDRFRLRIFNPTEFIHEFKIVCSLHSPFRLRPIHASAKLSVVSPHVPHVVKAPRSTKGRLGSRLVLECAARGWPAPKIAWMFVSRRHHIKRYFDTNGEFGDYIKEPNRLIITYMSYKTEGTYYCIAYSRKGATKARAQVGFDRRSSSFKKTKKLMHQIKLWLKAFRNYGSETKKIMYRKSTCTLDVLKQFSWTMDPIRELDEKTLTYDAIVLWLRRNAKWSNDLPGEARDVDVKLLKFLQAALQCTDSSQSKPMCNKYKMYNNRYATLDGSCNNYDNPTWGQAGTILQRFLQSQYEHGIFLPQGYQRQKLYGNHRKPSARKVSVKLIMRKHEELDHLISQEHNHFGQMLDHDIDRTAGSASRRGIHTQKSCNEHCLVDLPCFPIQVPRSDPRRKGCISFTRSAAFCSTGVSGSGKKGVTPREQINGITSFIDASFVYGSDCRVAKLLRDMNSTSGALKTSPPVAGGKQPMMPIDLTGVPTACGNHSDSPNTPCYSAGDVRSNEFAQITTIQTMFLREHNRISAKLHRMNPHWCPDLLYYETRRIIAAIMQQITYNEYVPLLIGKSGMDKYIGEYNGYKTMVNPSISNVFATSAFRFGHSNVAKFIYGLNETYQNAFEPLLMERGLLAPHIIRDHNIDPSIRFGITAPMKAQQKKIASYVLGLGERLFAFTSRTGVGSDLSARDIQRGRDHGLPSYNHWRVFCGLQWASKWKHLRPEVNNRILSNLKSVYGSTENIDLHTGLLMEDRVDDSLTGPTTQCLLGKQFQQLRDGDRFWFENPGMFTEAQVQEIKRYTYSRLVCNTVDTIRRIQRNAFVIPLDKNDLVSCSEIPDINLRVWKDTSRKARCMPKTPCDE